MAWRSPGEIGFRLRQESRNLTLWAKPPALPAGGEKAAAPFPGSAAAVDALRGTRTAEAITGWADQVLHHRFPLLGLEIQTGPKIDWRRDYASGRETGTAYFRRIPYLDSARAGDHKIIWELNRHQHLVLLAQAFHLAGSRDYLKEIEDQLDSWFEQNPYQRGINWVSALEVAFRSLSWMWVDHLAGAHMDPPRRRRLIEGLYRHALHLKTNLSVYFSPNTHLLGEAVALHALGLMFGGLPEAPSWRELGARVVAQEMDRQVRSDGSHFEQSSYYHVYALDMFLFHAILEQPSPEYRRKLCGMGEYLEALLGPGRSLPMIGDDDGGRFFHPFGPRERFGRATLAACGCFLDRPEWIVEPEDLHEYAVWWLGARAERADAGGPSASAADQSAWFSGAGMAVMRSSGTQCVVDAGSFGPFRAGHSHADTLSIVARTAGRDVLIDPGTFTYAADSPWRDRFRGTAAHNTVRLGGLDQADPAGNFGWNHPPKVAVRQWHTNGKSDFLDAECGYRGFRHRRRIFFLKPEFLLVLDDIDGGPVHAEQFWHPGEGVKMLTPACFRIANAATLILALAGAAGDLSEGGEFGWRSTAYGFKQPSPLIVCRKSGERGVRFGAALVFSDTAGTGALAVTDSESEVRMILSGAWRISVAFPESGVPRPG